MKISVTQDHIDRGTKCHLFHCPIALAVKEQNPEMQVSVSHQYCRLWAKDGVSMLAKYQIPAKAVYFIDRFDSGDPVKPFEFEMEEVTL